MSDFYGIDPNANTGYTGQFDAPAGMKRTGDKTKRRKLTGNSYEARVNRANKAKLGSRWYE